MTIRNILRPNIKRDRLRRQYRAQTSYLRTTTLGNGSGAVKGTRKGFYYVRDVGSADSNGNATYGPPYQLPIKPGAVIYAKPKREVYVGIIDGQEYITGMVFDDLIQSDIDPNQFNLADPSLQFKLIEHLQNLQAFPDANGAIQIMPGIYKRSDGTYGIFSGQSGIDIITGNEPSTDMQVVICLWLDESDNTVSATVSSEVSIDTDLKLDPATALTSINECAASAPTGSLGITSFIIDDTTTSITINNKFHDLRGIVGTGSSTSVVANTLTLGDGSELTLDTNGAVTIGAARHTLDTFMDAASDDLVTISGLAANGICYVSANHTDRTVVIKHQSDNIFCLTETDITLFDTNQMVMLVGNLDGTTVYAMPLNVPLSIDANGVAVFNEQGSATLDVRIEGDGSTHLFFTDASQDNIGINNSTPDATALLDLVSTTKGFGLPAMTGTQRLAVGNTRNGLLVFDITQQIVFLVSNSQWVEVIDQASTQAIVNKTMSMSLNTIGHGTGVIRTLSSDVLAASTDRNIAVAAQSGTSDDLIEVTGLSVGESVLLRADTGDTITVKHADSGATVKIYLYGDADVTLDEQNPLRLTLIASNVLVEDRQGGSNSALPETFNARLTLSSSLAVTTADVTAATTVYLLPYLGNTITLYDGSSAWAEFSLSSSGISIAVPASTNTMYDLFVYDSSGLTLEAVAWTNDTTRATAITLQDGVYVKSGTTTKRYVGTFRTTGTSGQCEKSVALCSIWNYYNRVEHILVKLETTDSWNYTTPTWRSANNSTANRVAVVIGVDEVMVEMIVNTKAINPSALSVAAGVGVDTTSANNAQLIGRNLPASVVPVQAVYEGYPGIGYHYFQWVEYSSATGTTTWYGDAGLTFFSSGIMGKIMA